MGGVAAAVLVALAMGVLPVYALMVGVSSARLGLLPGFIAGYLISFIIKQIESKVPDRLDLIVSICVAPSLARLIAVFCRSNQVDIIFANPIPVYITNFLDGGSSVIVSLSGLVNESLEQLHQLLALQLCMDLI
ncbi:PTS sugar transporter subunit IIC [Cerasibacillus sp. JNUCC 74]